MLVSAGPTVYTAIAFAIDFEPLLPLSRGGVQTRATVLTRWDGD